MRDRHFVAVWNPAYAKNAMEEHLAILLDFARRLDQNDASEDDVYVWWGKVRSSNRQQPQANLEEIRAIARGLSERNSEVQLYLTDYRSLYVADVDEILFGELEGHEATHAPSYYQSEQLVCDFWFRVVDIRRIVSDDVLSVIQELRQLRNVHYNDRPVSLYGGMVDLPLIVIRLDERRWFDEAERDMATGGRLWAEFDAEGGGTSAIERELRENLFGESAWSALDATTRIFIATGERVFREHRNDLAFDFAHVLGSFAKALEVQCNLALRRALLRAGERERQANLDGHTLDLTRTRALTIGELARVIGGERELSQWLTGLLENGRWFTGSLPPLLASFAEVRNAGTHHSRIDGDTMTRWRNRLLGVGCIGDFVELARVKLR